MNSCLWNKLFLQNLGFCPFLGIRVITSSSVFSTYCQTSISVVKCTLFVEWERSSCQGSWCCWCECRCCFWSGFEPWSTTEIWVCCLLSIFGSYTCYSTNLTKHLWRWDTLTGDMELVDSLNGHYDVIYGKYDPRYLTRYTSLHGYLLVIRRLFLLFKVLLFFLELNLIAFPSNN